MDLSHLTDAQLIELYRAHPDNPSNAVTEDQMRQRLAEDKPLERPLVDPTDLAAMGGAGALSRGMGAASRGAAALAEKAGLGGAMESIGNAVSSIPRKLMTSSVGADYAPQVGKDLLEEGIVGTRGMMQGQIEQGLANRGEQLQQAVSKIPGMIESAPVAEDVGSAASKYTTSGGITPSAVQSESALIANTAKDIAGRGPISPQEALELKRIAQRVGYKQGEPLSKLQSGLARSEAKGYGNALESAYESRVGGDNAVAEANQKLSSLLKGKSGLASSAAPSAVADAATVAGGAGIGSILGHPGMGTAAGAAKVALQSPLAESTLAHLLHKPAATAALGVWGKQKYDAAKDALNVGSKEATHNLEQEAHEDQ